MRKIIIAGMFFLTLTSFISLDARWARTYGGSDSDRAKCVKQTSDGGYIVAGSTESFGARESGFWIIKINSVGLIEWQRIYDRSFREISGCIQQTSDGGYIVAGSSMSFDAGPYDLWVLKLDSAGFIEWQRTYGGREGGFGHSIQQTSDGGYIVAGSTSSFGSYGSDIWILKLNPEGIVEWQRTYGNVRSDSDIAWSIQQTSDGGYIVAGETWSLRNDGYDSWVLKLNSAGFIEWQHTYAGRDGDFANSIQQTNDGGYIVAGHTYSFGAGLCDFFVLKLNSAGTIEWQRTYGGSFWERAYCIQQTSDGGYIVAGQSYSFGAGGSDCWILKLNSAGTIEWQRTYGGSFWERAYCIQQTSDGGYIVAGSTESFGVGRASDIWILKLSSDGNIDPSCGFIQSSNAIVSNSSVSLSNTSVVPVNSSVTPRNTNISLQDTNAISNLICSGKKKGRKRR